VFRPYNRPDAPFDLYRRVVVMISLADVSYVSQDGMRWAIRQAIRYGLKPGYDQWVLVMLAIHADAEGRARPSRQRLSELLGLAPRNVTLRLRLYRDLGIISSSQPLGGTNRYVLNDWAPLAGSSLGPVPEVETTAAAARNAASDTPRQAEWWDWVPARTAETNVASTASDAAMVGSEEPTPLDSQESTRVDSAESTPLDSQESTRVDSIESTEDSSTNALNTPHPSGVLSADADAAAPAAPGDRTPHDNVVVEFPAARQRRQAEHRDDAERATTALPRPQELADAYTAMVQYSPLVPMRRALTQRECIALTQAIKHPAFAGDLKRWGAYCLWASDDPYLRGDREGRYPADLLALTAARSIDRWAAATRPKAALVRPVPLRSPPPDTPVAREANDPNRRWNPKTEGWDHLINPIVDAFLPDMVFGRDDPKLKPGTPENLRWQAQRADVLREARELAQAKDGPPAASETAGKR
jgi:hypothetical protein